MDGTVDFSDIAPFIAVPAASGFQCEAGCNESGLVEFSDTAPFIGILAGHKRFLAAQAVVADKQQF